MITQQVLLFSVCAVGFALGMDRDLNLYDEGLILTGAMRVAAGDIPHRDFYANYGPAQFYLLAYLFKLFGQSVLVERVFDVLVRAMIVTVCYGVTASYCRKSIAFVTAVVCGVWIFSITFYGYPIFPILLLCLLSAALILPVLAGPLSFWRLLGAGAGVGLVALFRYDAGFFVFVALGCAIGLSAALRNANTCQRISAAKAMLIPYAAGTSAVFLPAAVGYLAVAPIAPFIHDIFSYPTQYYARMRSMPFPSPFESTTSIGKFAVYLPILVCVATVFSLALGRARIPNSDRAASPHGAVDRREKDWFLILFGLLTAALYLKGIVRVSILHMLVSLIPSLLLLGVLLERALHQRSIVQLIVGVVCVFTLAVTLPVAFQARFRFVVPSSVLAELVSPTTPVIDATKSTWCRTPKELERVACFLMDPDRTNTVRFLVHNTTPDERIFVGLKRHDKIVINDNITYFAVGRLPATRWHHFDPGLQTRADIQTEIVSELKAHAVRYVVLSSEWDGVAEPNDSAKSSGVYILDDYIREHYRPVRAYGKLSILFRDIGPRGTHRAND